MFRGHYISSRTVHLTSPDSTRREECRRLGDENPPLVAAATVAEGERERERDSDVVPTFSWNLVSSTRYFSPPLPLNHRPLSSSKDPSYLSVATPSTSVQILPWLPLCRRVINYRGGGGGIMEAYGDVGVV